MKTNNENCNVKISNIVATTDSKVSLNLTYIHESLENTEYNPEIYFALIYHSIKPKISILVNWSGKLIFTGGKSMADLELARDLFYNKLEKIGFYPEKINFQIQNLVITADFGDVVNTDFFTILTKSNHLCKESRKKGRVVFKNQNPKFTAIIFRRGKVSILGLKKIERISTSITIMKELLSGKK